MPTTRNRWQQETQPSPESAATDNQANQANATTERQTSPPRPSVSPASELADDFQDDPNPRSPKRRRLSHDVARLSEPVSTQGVHVGRSPMSQVSNHRDTALSTQMPDGQGAKPAAGLIAPGETSVSAPGPNQQPQTQPPTQTQPPSSAPSNLQPTPTPISHSPPVTDGHANLGDGQQRPASHTPIPAAAPTGPSNLPPTMPQAAASQSQASPVPPVASGQLPIPPAGPRVTPSVPQTATSQPVAPPPPAAAPAPRGPPPPPTEIIKRRLDSLPKLGEVSDQVLVLLSKMPVLDALALDADLRLLSSGQQPSSPAPAEYQRLRALFDPVRNLYVTGFPFLIADHLAMREPSQAATIRKANQAMFCSAIFAGGIGQLALDQAFLDIFVPENGQLLRAQSNIWLELKTQGFMTAMRLKAAPPNQVMSDLFPAGIESRIVARHPSSQTLTPSEQDFAARYEARRKILFEHISRNALPELDQKFTYVELATQVANFLIMTYGVGSEPVPQAKTSGTAANGQPQGQQTPNSAQNTADASLLVPQIPASIGGLPSFDSSDFIELAARAAAIAMRGTASPMPTSAAPAIQTSPAIHTAPPAQSQMQPSNQLGPNIPNSSSGRPFMPLETVSTVPHASQLAPTHVLYQRARVAEPIKSTTASPPRADGDPSQQRRTWSEEEEKALMDGLDRVQGPHWANIMALHGPGGSMSETLKEKNQVQLKDKARNLKMVFLKNKIEVPYFLNQVTGTLETRAPGQAERTESNIIEQSTREAGEGDMKSPSVQDLGQSHREAMEDVQSHDVAAKAQLAVNAASMNSGNDIKVERADEGAVAGNGT